MARVNSGGLSERGRHWQRFVAGWRRSGLTQTEFCRRHGVKHVTFCWWKRQLTERESRVTSARTWVSATRRADDPVPPIFAPVRIRADEPAGRDKPVAFNEPNAYDNPSIAEGWIEIVLGGGRRIGLRGRVDRQALADVLAVLEAPAC